MGGNSRENAALESWRNGVPLNHAPDEFGVTKALAGIRRKARSDARRDAEMGKASFRKVGKNADAAYDALEPALASFKVWSETGIAKQDRLFERLRTGELIALGFPVHEADAAIPIQVPLFMLDRKYIKWGARAFVGLGRHYADVTICQPLPAPTPAVPDPKPIGAPSFAKELEALAFELEGRGVDLNAKPWKTPVAAIRDLARERQTPRFTDISPSYETIRRFLEKRNKPKS